MRKMLLGSVVAGLLSTATHAQVRVVNYNVSQVREGVTDVLGAIGTQSAQGIARPIDILLLQEQGTLASTTQSFVTTMNGLYGTSQYARGTLQVATSGGGRPAVVYNTSVVTLIAEQAVATVGTDGAARQTVRYTFRPVGYDSSADFYVYNSHFKASDTSGDRARRGVEAGQIRANADALGQGAHVIYAGDFNLYTSSESAFANLTAAGNGQAFDPINRVGNWSNSASFRDVHTQSPATSSYYGGQVTGGVDDRFDFQLSTAEVQDDEGFAIIDGTYRAFGNNGTHSINGSIATGSGASASVLTALTRASDHLPVVADYQLPAKMSASTSLASLPATVIRGASVQTTVSVSNVAPVAVAIGADELDYTVTGSGALSGIVSGSDAALGGANSHAFTVNTAGVGTVTAGVSVTATGPQTANGTFTQSKSLTVLDHANASFEADDNEDALTIDFGTVALGSNVDAEQFTIFNLLSGLGATAGLDLDGITASGDTGAFSLLGAGFTNLAAGSGQAFEAMLDTSAVGAFSAIFTFGVSDQDLLGATAGPSLTLTLLGEVVPVPEPASLAVLGLAALTFTGRRR